MGISLAAIVGNSEGMARGQRLAGIIRQSDEAFAIQILYTASH